jgi:hypothetical protein
MNLRFGLRRMFAAVTIIAIVVAQCLDTARRDPEIVLGRDSNGKLMGASDGIARAVTWGLPTEWVVTIDLVVIGTAWIAYRTARRHAARTKSRS